MSKPLQLVEAEAALTDFPLYAIDIETACNMQDCPHYLHSAKCDHSLSPWHGRVTVVAVHGPRETRVFKSTVEAQAYLAKAEALSRDRIVIGGHGFKFDLLWLKVVNSEFGKWLEERWIFDSYLMFYTWQTKIPTDWIERYNAQRPSAHHREAGQHSLKTLAPYFLGVESYWETEDHSDVEYAAKDVVYTRGLIGYALANMDEASVKFTQERLMPWTKMVVEAELEGLKLNVNALERFRAELEEEVTRLEAELDTVWAEAHEAWRRVKRDEINAKYDAQKPTKAREPRRQKALEQVDTLKLEYSSPKQMAFLLRDFFGYDIMSLEGEESTGREVLERLAANDAVGVKTYLEWRKAKKILTAFIPSFMEMMDMEARIHPVYNIAGTRTGRLSSERPNAQQVPSRLKQFFSPGSGRVLLGYDQAAIEAKLIGYYTEDETLCQLLQSGESIHNLNTKIFFNLPDETPLSNIPVHYKQERKITKNVGFALFYNAGANRIRITFAQGGRVKGINECRSIHKRFLASYPQAIAFNHELVARAEEGEVYYNILGRPLKIQDPSDAYMTAFNTLVQSSASDINMDRSHAALLALRGAGIDARPHLFVHDYVGISVPEKDADLAKKIVEYELVNFRLDNRHGQIKLEVEGDVSHEWN